MSVDIISADLGDLDTLDATVDTVFQVQSSLTAFALLAMLASHALFLGELDCTLFPQTALRLLPRSATKYSRAMLFSNAGSLGELGLTSCSTHSLAAFRAHFDFNVTSSLWIEKRFLLFVSTHVNAMAAGISTGSARPPPSVSTYLIFRRRMLCLKQLMHWWDIAPPCSAGGCEHIVVSCREAFPIHERVLYSKGCPGHVFHRGCI